MMSLECMWHTCTKSSVITGVVTSLLSLSLVHIHPHFHCRSFTAVSSHITLEELGKLLAGKAVSGRQDRIRKNRARRAAEMMKVEVTQCQAGCGAKVGARGRPALALKGRKWSWAGPRGHQSQCYCVTGALLGLTTRSLHHTLSSPRLRLARGRACATPHAYPGNVACVPSGLCRLRRHCTVASGLRRHIGVTPGGGGG